MQPATIRRLALPNFLYSAISRIDSTDSCWADAMNEQVFTTSTSASPGRGVISQPFRASMPIITSLSTRFFGHPKLTNPTFSMSPLFVDPSGPVAELQLYHASQVRSGLGGPSIRPQPGTAGLAVFSVHRTDPFQRTSRSATFAPKRQPPRDRGKKWVGSISGNRA